MYRIFKDGAQIGLSDTVTYVRMLDNGCLGLCAEGEAQGIVHDGVVYHLVGRSELPGYETVLLNEVDAGRQLSDIQSVVDDVLLEYVVDMDYRLSMVELGVTE
jgi:hypothetical protein